MAAAILFTQPVFFLVVQRRMVPGITAGVAKGRLRLV
jgi:ABC-type maltose transport system permease subunit